MEKQQVLNALLEETLSTVKQAKDFTIEQAPDLAKEVIAEAKAQNYLALFLGLFLGGFGLYVFFTKPMVNKFETDGTLWTGLVIVLLLMANIISLIALSDLISLKTAPKTYVLRKLAKTIKGES